MKHHQNRKLEALLLAAVQIVLLCGLALVYFGKQVTTASPAGAVNVNTVTARQLSSALAVDAQTGQALIAKRGHGWASVYALRHAKALKGVSTAAIGDSFVVRSPKDVARAFWGGVLALLVAGWVVHGVLRTAAFRADPFLLPLAMLLAGLGLMLVYSVKDPYRDTFAFGAQAWGVALYGTLALLVPLTKPFGRLPLRRYGYAYAGAAVLLMLGLLLFGHGPGGVHIQLLGVEPVEVIKLLLVLFVASYLAERGGSVSRPIRDLAPLAGVYALGLILFVVVKDLGPAVLLFGVFLALLYLTTRKALYPLLGIALLGAAAFVGNALHFGFFATRVTMWLHPWDNADRNGAQLAQGLWGMATGGTWGSGLGLGHPEFVPRSGSDSVFATLGEQLGLVGGLVVLAVYALFIARGLRIARNAGTEFDRLLASGLTLLLGFQSMLILGGVSGLIPLTGVTLPFVSFGASSLVCSFFAVGLLLQISGKTLPAEARDIAPPEWTRAARGLALGCAAYLLVGVGLVKLMDVQGVRDTFFATRPLYTPDRDTGPGQPPPPHINPRLLGFALALPRGTITDRAGRVLARDAAPTEDAAGVSFLTPDGRGRIYPGGAAFGQIVAAVERPYAASNPLGQNGRLRGFASYADLLTPYRMRFLPFHHTPQGQAVVLTLDSTLQNAASDALHEYASRVFVKNSRRPEDRGAAVLLDSRTGDVLALASEPTFDPAKLTAAQWAALAAKPDGPVLNRAVSGVYPPGSVFKIVTAASALSHGLGNTVVVCHHMDDNVSWRFDGKRYSRRRITDEEGFVPHGVTDLAKALQVSCNVYFANLGIDLGAQDLDQTARQNFALAHLPPVAKIGEDLPDCAYGQGKIVVTPLEMAAIAQAVANNGQRLAPTFFKSAPAPTPTPAMTPENAAALRPMLAAVTQSGGTAQGVFDGLSVSVAGKTGSAQNAQGAGRTHSWFAGYAPADTPSYAFACVVENAGSGRGSAAPVCREMLRRAFETHAFDAPGAGVVR